MKFTHANNISVHYALSGMQGNERIVFINSLGTDLRIWADVVAALAKDYQCLCYDKRGHGLSEGDDEYYSIDLLTDDLTALLDRLQWNDNIVIVGLSVGGLIGQNFAYRYPQRLAGLVLMDTAAQIGTLETWNNRIDSVRANGLAAISEKILSNWFTPAFKKTKPDAYCGYRNMLERTNAKAYCATCIALRDCDLTRQSATLALPTLVIVGQEDRSTPPHLVRKTANLIKDADFFTIDACGHLPCIEQPDVTINTLKTFIREKLRG